MRYNSRLFIVRSPLTLATSTSSHFSGFLSDSFRVTKLQLKNCRIKRRLVFVKQQQERQQKTQRPFLATSLWSLESVQHGACKFQSLSCLVRQGRGRGGKTTSGNGQAWSSTNPSGQWGTEKNGENWLWSHLWCPKDPCRPGVGEGKGENANDWSVCRHVGISVIPQSLP